MAESPSSPADQLTGQRWVEQESYSPDPQEDAMIRANLVSSRYTVAALKPAELKRILRLCSVPPAKILRCATTHALVELAAESGIVDVPDQWTLDSLKQQQDEARRMIAHERNFISGRVQRPE